MQKGEFEKAIADFDKAFENMEEPESSSFAAEIYVLRGEAYFQKGDYGRAISDFEASKLDCPNLVEAYYLRGKERVRLGDEAEDEPAIDEPAVGSSPLEELLAALRPKPKTSSEYYASAIEDFEAVLRINPSHTKAKQMLAEARRKLGK
jgi:tetratricopeptide (TPR) repeat protein